MRIIVTIAIFGLALCAGAASAADTCHSPSVPDCTPQKCLARCEVGTDGVTYCAKTIQPCRRCPTTFALWSCFRDDGTRYTKAVKPSDPGITPPETFD